MNELQELDAEAVAHSISYALKRDRKTIQRLQSCDDEGHFRAARGVVDYLRQCGYRFFRRPVDHKSFMASLPPQKRNDDG